MPKEEKEKGAFNLTTLTEYADISMPTALSWVRRQDFPAFRSGRRWIIPREPFIEWLRKQAEARAEL